MIATLMTLSLHLVAAPNAPVDVFDATVTLQDVDLLLVASADRDQLKEKLAAVRKHRLAQAKGATPRPLVIAIDISDVPSFMHGRAQAKLKERAIEVAKHQPKGAPHLSFVADHDASVSRAFRGPLKGSCLIRVGAQGERLDGVTVDEIVANAGAMPGSQPSKAPSHGVAVP